MTLAQLKLHPQNRQRPRRVWSSEEIENLWTLAERLQGRSLPGVHLTEAEFWAEYGVEDINVEWVEGEVIVMAPASGDHSDLLVWLLRLLSELVELEDLGLVRGPEFPIRLTSIQQVRSPDVVFISKSKFSKLHPTYLDGAPDLIFEIVSPDSTTRDWRDKYSNYQSAGVREYWVVDPLSKRVEAYTLGRSKKYALMQPDEEGRIHSKVLKRLFVDPTWLWRAPLPKLNVVLKELKLR